MRTETKTGMRTKTNKTTILIKEEMNKTREESKLIPRILETIRITITNQIKYLKQRTEVVKTTSCFFD